MRLPDFHYFRPKTIDEALLLLGRLGKEAKVLAGGTVLLVDLQQRLVNPAYVISLTGIPELRGIGEDNQLGLSIGALTTLDDIKKSPLLGRRYRILGEAAEKVGVPPLHHVATIGGNLCQNTRCIYYNQSSFWTSVRPPCFKRGSKLCHAVEDGKRCLATYQGDLAPALLALEARVRLIRPAGERTIPLSQLFTQRGEPPNCLEPDEILAEVQVPSIAEPCAGAYEKLRIRGAMDFPLASVAVRLETQDNRECRRARIVLGAVAPSPIIASRAEQVLTGKTIDEDVIEEAAQEVVKEAHPVANLSLDADYRRTMIGVMLKRAIKRALAKG